MATKLNQLKNNNSGWLMRAVVIFLLLLLSAGVVAGCQKFYEHSKSWYEEYDTIYRQDSLSEENELLRMLLAKNYTFGANNTIAASTLFSGFESFFNGTCFQPYELHYSVVDLSDNILLATQGIHYATDPQGHFITYDDYDLEITFNYDADGVLTVTSFNGFRSASADYAEALYNSHKNEILDLIYIYSQSFDGPVTYESPVEVPAFPSNADEFYKTIEENVSLKNLEITYVIPSGYFFYNYNEASKEIWALQQSGLPLFFTAFFLIAFILGVLIPMKPLRFPAELSFIGAVTAWVFTMDGDGFTSFVWTLVSGEALATITEQLHLTPYGFYVEAIPKILQTGHVLLWLIFGCITFLLGHSLRLVGVFKPKEWFFTCTLTGRFLRFLKTTGSRFGQWVMNLIRSVDFSEDLDKKLLKLVGIQFLIAGLLSLTWFFGTFGLFVYSVFLFFFLKKYALDLKKKYEVLLAATDEMAEGNLNITINEDLGLFAPVGDAVLRIQKGFKKAVDEEVKSQKMKTELITNVSHDLKTPLTAIITYVNLLKDETITEEERRSYIDTLDKKSLRLKQLIEDLFEVSKANSNNIQLNLHDVDLAALIKQASLELEDTILASQIDFRYQLPEEKLVRRLDSEKTYRIIENLMINITKYALPHSRAYIELTKEEEKAVLTMKNISAAELNFSTEEITERFTRGDKSRSTEGSGLGLAIVKSFTEVQGGELTISTDGDLFKVMVVL